MTVIGTATIRTTIIMPRVGSRPPVINQGLFVWLFDWFVLYIPSRTFPAQRFSKLVSWKIYTCTCTVLLDRLHWLTILDCKWLQWKKTDLMSLCIDKTQVITVIKWELLKSLIVFIYLCFVIDSCNFRYRRPTIKLKNLVLWFFDSIMNILWCVWKFELPIIIK